MTLLIAVLAIALTVFAVLRILQAPLGRPRPRRPRGPLSPAARLGKAIRAARKKSIESEVSLEPGVRAASSRLLIALFLIGAGAALLIVVAVRWIGSILRGILS